RDGQTDRLWVTSQGATSIGADLTVARNDNDIVAGASITSDQTTGQASEREIGAKRNAMARAEAKGDGNSLKPHNAPPPAVVPGTAGYLAKFTSATDLGSSSIVDQNGTVGIGTTTPGYKLHLAGHTTYDWPIIKLQNLDSGGHSYWLYGGARGIPGDFGIYD